MGHTGPAVKVCAKQVALSWKCLLWDPPDRTPPPPPTPMCPWPQERAHCPKDEARGL